MNRLGLKAGGLGHALGCAAGRGAKEQVDALRSENAQDRIDEGRLADSWAAGNDEHLRQQSQADCLGLTAGEREASLGLDPGECLMRVDVGPRQSAICQKRQTPLRKTQAVSPTASATTVRSASSRSRAVWTSSFRTPNNSTVDGTSSSAGRPQ